MKKDTELPTKSRYYRFLWWGVIVAAIALISYFHINTPPSADHIHLILMQAYFIPILIGAFQLGIQGGLGSALLISIIFTPHLMFQWVGDFEHNLLAVLQMVLFNVIGYLTGLKAQKEAQEKQRYRQTAGQLEKTLEKLKTQSVELAELEEQLRRADRLAVVGELTASLAHELRNPLATIRGIVEILNDEMPEEMKKMEFFQILIAETERMSGVVDNYLNFSRKENSPESRYDVREIVHNSCLILASRARRAGIRMEETLPETPITLQGDPNDLRQVLVNLMLNALEAMSSPGKIEIFGQLLPAREMGPQEATAETPTCLRLSIKDQGEGIAEEHLNEVFKPFYTTKKNGTGLGLSIVKRIVDQHHWRVEVTSKPGHGTTFILWIPLNPSINPNQTGILHN